MNHCRPSFRSLTWRRVPLRGLAVTAATVGVATTCAAVAIPASGTTRSAATCTTKGWTTAPKLAAPATLHEVYNVRAGRHSCYDRVVFDINGPDRVGYTVRYVPVVRADGSGTPVRVAGGAALAVGLHAPDFGAASFGHQPGRTPWRSGQVLTSTPTWSGLRQVKFAGGFEGYSAYAVGTREKLPFRVTTWTERGYTHVIVDIAHW